MSITPEHLHNAASRAKAKATRDALRTESAQELISKALSDVDPTHGGLNCRSPRSDAVKQ